MNSSRFVWTAAIALVAGYASNAGLLSAAAQEVAQQSSLPASDTAPAAMEFPRTITLPSGSFTVHEPQIEDHAGFTQATAWSAAVYRPSGGREVFGAVKYRAKMVVDQANRLVTIYDREVLEIKFPTLSDEEVRRLIVELRANVVSQPEIMPLDVVLRYVAGKPATSVAVEVSYDPPAIYYATERTLLLALDGESVKVAVDGADGLSIIVNTNWDLFYTADPASYWLLLGDTWLRSSTLEGPWRVAKAPSQISALPDNERWRHVRAAVPGGNMSRKDVPVILVSKSPAELIVTNGPAQLEPIHGTKLSFVANTSSDIVYNAGDRSYYFLTSGRWFKAASLYGPWVEVNVAPTEFQSIPAGHPRARVRASVAGTPEAELAVAQAQIPTTAEVSRQTAAPEVQFAGNEAVFERIEGTEVYRATNTTFFVFRVDGTYYLCHSGIWFVSESWRGPWRIADTIPAQMYTIPTSSPAHHVTYVTVYESSPDTVYVGYTPGYKYNYVSNGVVVYGSGYYYGTYYNPYYYTYYPSYYYHAYPRTYGTASIYNTSTGTYAHGHYAYGPNGGYAAGNYYNPNTGRYGGGVYAYDYDTAAYEGWSYNPRTDVSTSSSQSIQWSDGDSYETWGETVVQRDDDWVKAERYGTEEGFARQVETSQGGQAAQVGTTDNRATVGKTAEGDLYAGANGNVYRRTEEGEWETHSDGEWSAVDTDAARNEASGRAAEAGVDTSALSQTSVDKQAARNNASSRASNQGIDTSTLSQNERVTGLRSGQTGAADLQRLERDQSARTNGRADYNSFRSSSSGARGGDRMGGRSGRGGRR